MPLTRQQTLRRRRIVIFTAATVVLAGAVYVPATQLAPLDPAQATLLAYEAPVGAAVQPDLPGYGASGIGAVDMPGLLATGGSDQPLPIASISKVITTLVVLDTKPIAEGTDGETITFTSADVQVYNDYIAANGSVKPVRAGLTLTQREVLELMLIGSANNYAQSLVNWAFGSEEEYAAIATAWLAANGMSSTSISDATGMSPKNTSTAADLVTLGKLALAHPVVAEIIAQKKVAVPDVADFSNTNKLLGIDGIDGIKTGTLDEAGACLLFSADVAVGDSTVTLVGVVLGGPDHETLDANVRALLRSVVSGFREVTLATAGERFASYSTDWGTSTAAVATADTSAVVWSDTPVLAVVAADPITLGRKGEEIGSVTFTVGQQRIEIPLTAGSTISDPGPWWRLTNPTELF